MTLGEKLRSETGNKYINRVVILIVGLVLAAIIIRLLVGPTGLFQQMKEENARKQSENNIVIELTNSSK